MHKVLIGIGTNSDASFNMKQATYYLLSHFPNIKFTNWIETQPFGVGFNTPFINSLAYFETDKSKNEVQLQLKAIEKKMGRKPSHKTEGVVIIDIDLIKWDYEVLKPDDIKRDYMQQLIQEINVIMND